MSYDLKLVLTANLAIVSSIRVSVLKPLTAPLQSDMNAKICPEYVASLIKAANFDLEKAGHWALASTEAVSLHSVY